MKSIEPPKAASLIFAAVALASVAAQVAAHTQNGSLGSDAGATDYYQVSCTDDGSGPPASIVVQVQNQSSATAPPAVSALVHRGIIAANTTDGSAGDTSASPLVSVNAADGVYNVFVTKSAAGAAAYTLTFHCMTGPDGTGLHTGTTIVFRQNQ